VERTGMGQEGAAGARRGIADDWSGQDTKTVAPAPALLPCLGRQPLPDAPPPIAQHSTQSWQQRQQQQQPAPTCGSAAALRMSCSREVDSVSCSLVRFTMPSTSCITTCR
jgi:hypothetical protein